jgi:hypothetical protein
MYFIPFLQDGTYNAQPPMCELIEKKRPEPQQPRVPVAEKPAPEVIGGRPKLNFYDEELNERVGEDLEEEETTVKAVKRRPYQQRPTPSRGGETAPTDIPAPRPKVPETRQCMEVKLKNENCFGISQ